MAITQKKEVFDTIWLFRKLRKLPSHHKHWQFLLYVQTTVVHRFSRKFQFDRKRGNFAAANCGTSALHKIDFAENIDLIENFAVTNFSTNSALHCTFHCLIFVEPFVMNFISLSCIVGDLIA